MGTMYVETLFFCRTIRRLDRKQGTVWWEQGWCATYVGTIDG